MLKTDDSELKSIKPFNMSGAKCIHNQKYVLLLGNKVSLRKTTPPTYITLFIKELSHPVCFSNAHSHILRKGQGVRDGWLITKDFC